MSMLAGMSASSSEKKWFFSISSCAATGRYRNREGLYGEKIGGLEPVLVTHGGVVLEVPTREAVTVVASEIPCEVLLHGGGVGFKPLAEIDDAHLISCTRPRTTNTRPSKARIGLSPSTVGGTRVSAAAWWSG